MTGKFLNCLSQSRTMAASTSLGASPGSNSEEFVFYVTRHGHRMQWRGNELNLSPTGRPRDPVLTAHGVDQVKQMAAWFKALPTEQQPQMIISSPYYRCVQTAGPTAEALDLSIHIEPGECINQITVGSLKPPLTPEHLHIVEPMLCRSVRMVPTCKCWHRKTSSSNEGSNDFPICSEGGYNFRMVTSGVSTSSRRNNRRDPLED